MKKHAGFFLSLICTFALISQGYAQFTEKDLQKRDYWEDFLKTGEIIEAREIGEGVTKPIRLTLKKKDVVWYGAWKNPRGMQLGNLEGWQYEIAAYEMDKLLGLNMVPPTVERKYEGKSGSLQLWVTPKYNLLQMMENDIAVPDEHKANAEKMKYLARAFDSLIANADRTQQNYMYTEGWRVILIDHSQAFRSSRKYQKKLIFGKNAEGRPKPFRRLPRKFVDKITGLNFEILDKALGSILTEEEINAILKRQKLILEEIKEMIREKGEENVLYD